MFKSKGSHAKRQSFSGEDIIVKDSRIGRIYDLKVYGKSYQRKNLLPIRMTSQTSSGITITSNGDGTYTVNGTATGTVHYNLLVGSGTGVSSYVYPPAGDYILTGCPQGGSADPPTYFIELAHYRPGASPEYVYPKDAGNGYSITLSQGHGIRVYIVVRQGVTMNNLIFKPMLRRADTSPDFEPGDGGRFMPEAPSEILNVPSEIGITINNKNIFTTDTFGVVSTPALTHYMTVVGTNAFTSTKNVSADYQSNGFICNVYPDTHYTISFDFEKEILIEGSDCTLYDIRLFDKTGDATRGHTDYFARSGYVGIGSISSGHKSYTFTTPTGCDMIGIVFSFVITPAAAPWHERVKMHLSNVQLELGSNATEFVPYRRNVTPITIRDADNNLHTLGKWDYVDYLTGKIVKGGHTVEFNGDEDWDFMDYSDDWVFFVYVPAAVPGDVQECVCNQALYLGWLELNRCYIYARYFHIRLPKARFADLNAWKAHLSTTPLVVEYELETPQVYDLHPDEKINKPYTIEGDNYITTETDNGVKPDLEFRAISYHYGE